MDKQRQEALESLKTADQYVLISFKDDETQRYCDVSGKNMVAALLFLAAKIQNDHVEGFYQVCNAVEDHIALMDKLNDKASD